MLDGDTFAMFLLIMCSRLNLEASRREQRLLLEPRRRATTLGSQWYTTSAPRQDPSPSSADAHPLYIDWSIFNQWLNSEDHGAGSEPQIEKLPPGDDTQSISQEADPEISSAVYRLRREVEDAILFESNSAERTVSRQRFYHAPSDAMKQSVRELYVPLRDHVCGS
jgi:hypothetical protein